MKKTVAAITLILVFLAATFLAVAKPVSGAATSENTWVTRAPMHVARSGLGVAVVNGKIYAIGGSSRTGAPPYTGGFVGTNEEYDPETDKWTLKASMPTPRANFRVEVVQNKIYCISGNSENGDDTQANEVYDPSTDTWQTRAPLPTPRDSFSTVVYNNRIYVIGGMTGYNSTSGFWMYTGATEVYDPALDIWETKASMLNAVYPESSAAINGKIYVICGSTTYAGSISVTAVYDEVTDKWTNKASMPVVKHGASVAMDEKIYFIGGSYEGLISIPTYEQTFVTLLQIYDPSTNTWSEGARPPEGGVGQRSAFATTGAMSPRRIYVVDYNLRIYDPEKNEWTLGPNRTTDRYFMGIVVLKDKIYAIGGLTEIWPSGFSSARAPTITTYASNEVYTPVGYGTPDASYILETTPPKINVTSPSNQTYIESSVPLAFSLDKQVSWVGYSFDGKQNVSLTGNSTIANMTNGFHSITVYANDTFGNIGASETVSFTVAVPEPFPVVPVAAVVGAAVVVGTGLLVYRKKHKR
jgi:N-acetylneuraminic acid mutarotase